MSDVRRCVRSAFWGGFYAALNVSEQPIGPLCMGQEVQVVSKRRWESTILLCVKSHRRAILMLLFCLSYSLGTSLSFSDLQYNIIYCSLKWSRYRPGVAQRVGRGIALLFHDRGTRRGWVVSCTPRPHFIPGKDPVPILQKAGWAPGPVWTGGKSRPHWDSIPDRPARSQSL